MVGFVKNRVNLVGRLICDPKLSYYQNKMGDIVPVVKLAFNTMKKDNKGKRITRCFTCVSSKFNLVKFISKYLIQGSGVRVQGFNCIDIKNKKSTNVIIEKLNLLD
jgi:single-stranded DNA-binding protein